MNDRSPLDPQSIAERVGAGMFAQDAASQGLGISIDAMGPDYAKLSMNVRPEMLNGFKICHGGFITTLADSAFAFACNSRNQLTVAAGLTVDFLQQVEGDELLTATATEVSRSGRTGVYDIVVTNRAGERVALVRGRSSTLTGRTVVPVALNEEAP